MSEVAFTAVVVMVTVPLVSSAAVPELALTAALTVAAGTVRVPGSTVAPETLSTVAVTPAAEGTPPCEVTTALAAIGSLSAREGVEARRQGSAGEPSAGGGDAGSGSHQRHRVAHGARHDRRERDDAGRRRRGHEGLDGGVRIDRRRQRRRRGRV